MGSSFSQIQQKAQAQQKVDQAECNDALNALQELGKAKIDWSNAYTKSDEYFGDLNVPIKQNVTSINQCYYSVNPSAALSGVTEIINPIVSSEFTTPVISVITNALTTLFENYSENASQKSGFLMILDKDGSLARLDYLLYSYKFTSTNLTSLTENMLIYSIVVSTCDVSRLDANYIDFLVLEQYNTMKKSDSEALINLLSDAFTKEGGHEEI